MKVTHQIPTLILVDLSLPAPGQSTIRSSDRYSYGANAGWADFRPNAGHGVRVTETDLSGKAYSAKLGWISLESSFTNLTASSIAYPDTGGDGIAGAWERRYFSSLTTISRTTDYDGDGQRRPPPAPINPSTSLKP